MKHTKTTRHNYVPKIYGLMARLHIGPGDVMQTHVSHDDWCDIFAGGFCNCDCYIKYSIKRAGDAKDK